MTGPIWICGTCGAVHRPGAQGRVYATFDGLWCRRCTDSAEAAARGRGARMVRYAPAERWVTPSPVPLGGAPEPARRS